MLHPKMRRALELIDTWAVEQGQPTWSELEKALADARERANVRLAASVTWQMGTRLSSIATMSRMSSGSDQPLPEWMPSESDALEPAADLFRESLNNAGAARDAELEKLARRGLADCYIQAKEFRMAMDHLRPLAEICHMPDDAKLLFEATQKSGDCYLELEDDEAALTCYEAAMQVARAVEDPFEISTQHGKLASALANLKRYDEAVRAWDAALALLIRIGNEPALQGKINFHKQHFNTAALPRLIAYTEQRLAHTKEAIGRDLLRELPHKLAVAVSYPGQINWSEWPVFRELDVAVRYATAVLAKLMDDPGNKGLTGESAVAITGALARRHFGEEIPDPDTLPMAARYLMQADRARRAANYVRSAEQTKAGPGPSGGGSSGHVLYLRSFIVSPKLPRVQLEHWGEVDLEELLACRLDVSPIIALGHPDLERFGPGRAPTSDENWRDILRVLAPCGSGLIQQQTARADREACRARRLLEGGNSFRQGHGLSFGRQPVPPCRPRRWARRFRRDRAASQRGGGCSGETVLHPAFFNAASCRAGVWSSVVTRPSRFHAVYFALDICNMRSPLFTGLPAMTQNLPFLQLLRRTGGDQEPEAVHCRAVR